MTEHLSVLLHEAVDALVLDPDGVYVDCTFGRGGHSKAILERLSPRGRLLVFDQDDDAIEVAISLSKSDDRVHAYHVNFTQLNEVITEQGLIGQLTGVLADFGVSSPQIDTPERGFSFRFDAPLDMRMDRRQSLDARQVVANQSEEALAAIFYQYGEERRSRRIAKAIVLARQEAPIDTTLKLAKIVQSALPRPKDGRHPATKVFQALRIYVNAELDAVDQLLKQLPEVLKPGGAAVLISFHSLEDRRVKQYFRGPIADAALRHLPVVATDVTQSQWQITAKQVKAGATELANNPRASSAVLRAARWNP